MMIDSRPESVYHPAMALKKGANGLPVGLGFYWKGRVIYVAISHRGVKHVHCCGTSDIDEAVAFRKAKLTEILNQDVTTKNRVVRIGELLDDYITHLKRKEAGGGEYTSRKHETSSYKTASRINANLRPAFGELKPEDLTDEVLNAYRLQRLEKVSVVSVNSEFRLLRAALRRGIKATPRKVNPFHIPASWPIDEKAEAMAANTGTITDEQYQRLLAELADHMKPVFAVAQYTGARAKELKFVRRTQVDFAKRIIMLKIGETKSGEPRALPLNDHVYDILKSWDDRTQVEYPSCEWLFHYNGKQMGTWRTAWDAAVRRAGLQTVFKVAGKRVTKKLVTFHDTRRTMVTSLEGMAERHIQKVSGHKTVSMVRRYDQTDAAELVRQVQNEKLAAKSGEGKAPLPVAEAPVASGSDWKAELRDLKDMLDAGLLPEDIYRAEVAKVMASRRIG